ncbi:hypothetical protein HWV62_42094 [Athelia sp. TMB]|nr:hypothetical protein HWV62_42094 [Athelia sp. TMB]
MPDLMLSDTPPSANIPDLTGQVAYQTTVGVGAAASGAHGHVVPGTWTTAEGSTMKLTPELTVDMASLKVAVKIILVKQHITSEVTSFKLQMFTKRCRRETKVWCRTHHKNVVPFLGIAKDYTCPFAAPNPVAMISLWMDGGDLMNALNTGLTESKRLHLLFGAAKGLEHLHSLNIIHGDLYPANILINANGDACLTDFGLSVIFPEFCGTSYWSRTAGGAIRWRAPELLPPSSGDDLEIEAYVPVLTRHCDIYSFGSVALHVMSGKIPYHNIDCEARVILLMGLRKQPSRPPVPHLTEPYWRLVTYCWGDRGDPTSRPSIEEVLQAISTLQRIISPGGSA